MVTDEAVDDDTGEEVEIGGGLPWPGGTMGRKERQEAQAASKRAHSAQEQKSRRE